jgi:glycosyltransferase involved in cell wall biosynthesis
MPKMDNDNKLFVIFNDTAWESDLKKARYYISLGLAEYHKVLFISLPPKREVLQLNDLMKKLVPRIQIVKKNLFVYEWPLWALQIYRFPNIRKAMKRMRFQLVKNGVKKLLGKSCVQLINYFTHPSMFDFFGIFENAITIYNPFDKFSAFGGGHNAHIEYLEQKYAPQFDLILCPHQQMVAYFKQLNKNTFFFPHGVDFELYSKATKDETFIPEEILNIKKPIIGYTGIINDRIDFDLLGYISDSKPDWSIVMIGPVRLSKQNQKVFDKLASKANIFYLGYQRPELLPNFMKNFDVAMIPYKVQNWVKWSSNPLKLHMYAAAGLCTVSCNLSNIEQFYDGTYIASDGPQWIMKIEKALEEGRNRTLMNKRLRLAAQNDWRRRVEFLLELISRKVKPSPSQA